MKVEIQDLIRELGQAGEDACRDEIYVDEEGEWYYKGNRIIRGDIIAFFLENLEISPTGDFSIVSGRNRSAVGAADTPFVVTRVDRSTLPSANEGEDTILLTLRHIPGAEPLDPRTLKVGKDNVLYCRVRSDRFPARFSRAAYYQLAEWIEQDPDSGAFYLELGGVRHVIDMEQA